MQFMVISTNTRDVTDMLTAESQRATELLSARVFRQVWPKADGSGAVVLAEAASEEALRAALDTMPTVVAGAASYLVVALAS